jgi:hypothetical protein
MTEDFDITDAKFKPLRAFTMHGTGLHRQTGNQIIGDCPFCFKEDHFYIHYEKLLWDCKVCGEKGNRQTFLEKVNERNKKAMTAAQKQSLADDRGLPVECMDWVELGHFRGQYTIAVRNIQRKLEDLRIYKIGGKVMSTAGSKAGLFGLVEMLENKEAPIWVCEGEWDTIAMQWLFKAAGRPGQAVCSPGAGTFKPEWADFFRRRTVVVAYDNDEAGLKGELTVMDRLAKKSKSLQFVHWPAGMPTGYDLRDFITKKAVLKKTPKLCFKKLTGLLKTKPRSELFGASMELMEEKIAPEIDPSVTIDDVFEAMEELYHEPNRMGIEMAIITMIAASYKMDPIWTFLVAPPSSGKTAILNSLKYLALPNDDRALTVSHITTHSLISGMETKRGDPSVFAQLDGTPTALVIKDFTGVLSMRPQDKEEIYGIMRDSYDGYTSKSFGNGIKREYNKLNFHCIAGVTDAIYDESANFQAMGERFCKLSISRGNDVEFARTAITKSMVNRDDFKNMEDRIARLVYSCVKNLIKKAEEAEGIAPDLDPDLRKALTGISLYVAAMRGVVSRDKYKRDYIKSAPSADTGIRNAKMLGAIAAMHAAVYGRKIATLEDLPLIRKIALDTINQRDEEILRSIYKKQSDPEASSRAMVQTESKYTPYTIRCVTEDLVMLEILDKKRIGTKTHYTLSPRMNAIIKDSKIYEDHEVLERVNHKVRLKRNATGMGKFSKRKLVIKKRGKNEKVAADSAVVV